MIRERSRPVESGCWLWAKALFKGSGYGVVHYGGKMTQAHRVAFMAFKGPIPPGLVIMHACDVPACVNPSHLSAGTYRDNTQDALAKGRMSCGDRHWTRTSGRVLKGIDPFRNFPERRPRGARHGMARLTVEQVGAIRASYAAGGVSYPQLALEHGVSVATVWRVVRSITWAGI